MNLFDIARRRRRAEAFLEQLANAHRLMLRDGLTIHYSLERDDVRRLIELLHQFYCGAETSDAPNVEKVA